MPLPFLGAGAGIAIRGAGKALLKNAVKRAKKTPNKQFKHVNIKPKKVKFEGDWSKVKLNSFSVPLSKQERKGLN